MPLFDERCMQCHIMGEYRKFVEWLTTYPKNCEETRQLIQGNHFSADLEISGNFAVVIEMSGKILSKKTDELFLKNKTVLIDRILNVFVQ